MGPDCLAANESLGVKETIEARKLYYRRPRNRATPFEFKAYKQQAVKDALNQLFKLKCAYCESSFAAVAPLDVEHYRPKSGYVVKDKLQKPGYYWLAAEWTNLLPSCIDCNRPRRQIFPDEPPGTAGKANKFPLLSERSRAKQPGRETREERLLLHPYFDRPAQHLVFDAQGDVKPRRRQGGESEMGRASIETYALQRGGLVQERKARALEIQALIKHTEDLMLLAERTRDPLAEQMVRDEIAHLKGSILDNRPYTLMAEQLIKPFLRRLKR